MLTAGTQGGEYDAQAVQLVKQILSMSVAGSYYKDPVNVSDYDWYCFDLLDYAVCEYHGADVEYTTGDEAIACTATVTVCCNLPGLEESDNNFTSWEHHLVGGDYMPKSYMTLSKEDYEKTVEKQKMIDEEINRLKTTFVGGSKKVTDVLAKRESAPLKTAASIADLMCRQELDYEFLHELDPERPDLPYSVREQVNIEIKYEGYIRRQEKQVAQFEKAEKTLIPDEIDYAQVPSLRIEARQKLMKVRPASIGQASRIMGVNPADLSVLLIYLKKMRGERNSEG